MTHTLSRTIACTLLAVALPVAALADLSETTILQTNAAINLDTGAIASSGGDLLWNGSTLAPQGNAKARSLPNLGANGFDLLPQSYFDGGSKATPIAASALTPGDGLAVTTNSGKTAKMLILGNSGGLLSIKFTTFGATAPAGVPTITQILNNSSQIPFGYPNYGIAPSSVFVVTGAGLADPGAPVLQSSTGSGIPLTLNGCSITVVVNNVTVHPGLYYTSPTQIAAVLPAGTPVGTGILTVTYKGTSSAPTTIQVVAAAVGINFYSQLGTYNTNVNIGVATDNFTGSLITFTNSATPGETIVLWSTGLGANPADSDTTYTSTPHAVSTPLQVYFGGVSMNVIYAGASTFPGVNEIIFTLPQNVPNGCYIPLVAVTGNIISNVVNFPVNKSGGSCFEQISGLTGDQILANTQNTLKAASVTMGQTNQTSTKGVVTVTNSASAAFQKYNGLVAGATGLMVTRGGCSVGPLLAGGAISLNGLDAGTITLTGPPALSVTLTQQIKGAFAATLPAGAIPSTGGTFTFKGSGGADVGPFTSTLTWNNPIFNWTNQGTASTIARTAGFSVTWTGGNAGTDVIVGGTVTNVLGADSGFTCRAAVEAGQLTVPGYILLGMSAGNGSISVQSQVLGTLTATGLDQGVAQGGLSFNMPTTFQ